MNRPSPSVPPETYLGLGTDFIKSSSGAKSWVALSILCLVALVATLDRMMLSLLIPPIKHDLWLTDAQFGLINGLIVTGIAIPASILVGWLADRSDRRMALAGCVVLWSLATCGCGFAQSFAGLSAGSIGITVGEAALIPLIYAILTQLFPLQRRLAPNATIYAVLVMGAAIALAAGGALFGFIDDHAGALPWDGAIPAWRLTFVAVALPGPFLALALLFVVPRAPTLGRSPGRSRDLEEFVRYLHVQGPTVLIVFVAMAIATSAWTSIQNWSPTILVRTFHQSIQQAGFSLGWASAAGCLAGITVSYFAAKALRIAGDQDTYLKLYEMGTWAAIPALALMTQTKSATDFLATIVVAIACLSFAVSLAPGLVQDAAPDRFRSRVIALFPVAAFITGSAVPFAVGSLSDRWSASPSGLLMAVGVVSLVTLPLGAVLLRGARRPYRNLREAVLAEDRGQLAIPHPRTAV